MMINIYIVGSIQGPVASGHFKIKSIRVDFDRNDFGETLTESFQVAHASP